MGKHRAPNAPRKLSRGAAKREGVLRTQFCFVCLCLATGQPLSQRAMAERFGLSRRRVSQLVTQVTASGNSHQHESEAA